MNRSILTGSWATMSVQPSDVDLTVTYNGTALHAQTPFQLIPEVLSNCLELGSVNCEEGFQLLNLLEEILGEI